MNTASPAALAILVDAVVWDNHACMPLRAEAKRTGRLGVCFDLEGTRALGDQLLANGDRSHRARRGTGHLLALERPCRPRASAQRPRSPHPAGRVPTAPRHSRDIQRDLCAIALIPVGGDAQLKAHSAGISSTVQGVEEGGSVATCAGADARDAQAISSSRPSPASCAN